MSGGEWTGGPASQSTRSSLEAQKWPPSIFGRLLKGSCRVTVVEPTGFLLRVYGPYRCLRDGYGILVCRLRLFACRVLHLRPPSPSSVTSFIPPPPRQERRPLRTSLSARAKANGYQRGAHRDKDSLRDQNKHMDKVKKDQDAALHRYVL